MASFEPLEELTAGTPLIFGGNRVVRVSAEMAERFEPGDSIVVVQSTGDVLHVPAAERALADRAVERALEAFATLNSVGNSAIERFFEVFAGRLEDDAVWSVIQAVNETDVALAEARGRSTTRLVASDEMRCKMAAGLRGWIAAPSRRGEVLEAIEHDGWTVELVGAALGPVGFVFEGRPNVLADATGVLRSGNPVVFRIGSDALRTAKAIMQEALEPALAKAGLPDGTVVLVESTAHAAGWALFSNSGLALAVARGSGGAVGQLGDLARQAGIPVSLHGTGGAWIVIAADAVPGAVEEVVARSLDRKVCNTLNTCCVVRGAAAAIVPRVLAGCEAAGAGVGQAYKVHVEEGDREHVPAELFERDVTVRRAGGDVIEKQAEPLAEGSLGHEWEWEQTPEITLKIVDDIDQAVALFNDQSPRLAASLVCPDPDTQEAFYRAIDAPFVGDSHTRWVDGQLALNRPELGLSNWQGGRLFGRGGILSGDGVYTVRTRARHR
ncbi:MAG: aldehyde dehydrogenase family protein [Acidobacteriota bacterium]|nr:aldehyde dehydrogenase family protein [Acidobacteriota bacterium]